MKTKIIFSTKKTMNYELTKICTDKITEYLEIDNISEIFDAADYIAIFGGAVRDSLANKEIHDVDIMCLPDASLKLSKYLRKIGFKKVDLYDLHQLAMYKEIHVISEPWTFIRGGKIIQIIKPATGQSLGTLIDGYYSLIDGYYSLLSDVDISACGVFLEKDRDSIIKLKESHENAITHCRSAVFETLPNNRMYGEYRTDMRQHKLQVRNWINLNIKEDIKDVKIERRMKLHGLQKPEYNYKSYRISKQTTKMILDPW
jgi:predicted nucleotidyltransferase